VVIAAIFLRLNNLGMVERRAAVYAADKAGDADQLQTAASDLQNYVAHHMNTTTGRIALQDSYNRDLAVAVNAARPPEINPAVYGAATENCRSQVYIGGYRAYAQCVANAVGQSETTLQTVKPPQEDTYYLSYAAPRLSLDVAGFMVMISILIIVVIFARLLTGVILRILLKIKYRAA
jgi:hypothetical protein